MSIEGNQGPKRVSGFFYSVPQSEELELPAFPSDEYVETKDDRTLANRSWQRYLSVPPVLRTWLTNAMIYLERVVVFLFNLEPMHITPVMQAKLGELSDTIELILHDFQSPYFDNASLSTLGLERIQNTLFRAKRGTITRININMTDANKLDPTGNLGSAYKYSVLSWLQENFGIRKVSLNPEGTSFMVLDEMPHRMAENLNRFSREIMQRLKLRIVQQLYQYDRNILSRFEPKAVAMYTDISADGLDIDETLETFDRQLILDLQDRVIARIEESLRILAVGADIAEKDPASIGLQAGLAVYNAADLPLAPAKTGYELFRHRRYLGQGYVPASVHWSKFVSVPFAPRNAPTEKMWRRPRVGHEYGRIDHPSRPGDKGGALQQLQDVLRRISQAKTTDEIAIAMKDMEAAVGNFGHVLNLGEMARANSRNPALIKYLQQVKFHDRTRRNESYFLENVALSPEPDVHMIVVEIDSFKAFSSRYPIDEEDSNFWGVFDQFFWVAKRMNLRAPIISQVAGDLIAVAVPTKNMSGGAVDIEDFIRQIQQRVKNIYGDKPFQDTAKTVVPNGQNGTQKVVRKPLWINSNGEITASDTKPEGSEPYMRTLTISAVGMTIATPKTAADRIDFFRRIHTLASRVEALKEETSPAKGAYRILREDKTPQLSIADFEDHDKETEGPAVFLPRETAGIDFNRLSMMDAINSQLEILIGDEWRKIPSDVKQIVLEHWTVLQQISGGPYMLNSGIVGQVMALMGYTPVQLPPINMMFMPPVIPLVL
jgi:hypothetical protein